MILSILKQSVFKITLYLYQKIPFEDTAVLFFSDIYLKIRSISLTGAPRTRSFNGLIAS